MAGYTTCTQHPVAASCSSKTRQTSRRLLAPAAVPHPRAFVSQRRHASSRLALQQVRVEGDNAPKLAATEVY